MVSFIEIINKLMDGDYAIATGSPDAPSKMKEFIEDVTSRIRELRGKEEWEIEDIVTDAIDWALEKICKRLKGEEKSYYGYYEEKRHYVYYDSVEMYECFHPEIGKFYMVINDEANAPSGYRYFGFELTRSKSEAEESYRSNVEALREEYI